MAIMGAILLFTIILWVLVLFMGKRQTGMLVLTVAVTIVAALAALNAAGYVDIWGILAPATAVVTP